MSDFFADLEAQLVAAHPRRRRARALAAAPALALVLVAVGAAGVGIAVGGDGDGSAPRPATTATAPPKDAPPVAVLNGTTVAGLGRSVAERLRAAGFRVVQVTDAPRQDVRETYVAHRPDALSAALDVGSRLEAKVVRRMRAADARVAGPFKIVVVVGEDAAGRRPRSVLAGAALRGPGSVHGTAELRRSAGRPALRLYLWGIASAKAPVGLWVGPRFLGVIPPARPGTQLAGQWQLPPGTAARGTIIRLTREHQDPPAPPTRPGPILASGTLR